MAAKKRPRAGEPRLGKRRPSQSAAMDMPILPQLRTILDASGLGHDTWLETSLGVSYSAAGFGNAVKDGCREAEPHACRMTGHRLTRGSGH
ncbi:MAG: hypothetical protein ACLPPF_23135 [Rhodomicrobium sp.]